MTQRHLALTISYDGTGFSGSQIQRGVRTVQGELEKALGVLARGGIRTVFAGRTDRGVHAAAQVVGCRDFRANLEDDEIREAINHSLPRDIAVLAVQRKDAKFHARYDARWREYRYRLWSGRPQPLASRYSFGRSGRLDLDLMGVAARKVVGTRDFASIVGNGQGVPWSGRKMSPRGTIRSVLRCECRRVEPWWGPVDVLDGALFELEVVADGFLPQMVRNLMSLIIEVGRGARTLGWMDEVLSKCDRRTGVATAPAHGLTLWRVGYSPFVVDETSIRLVSC